MSNSIFSPVPAYLLGTAFLGVGLNAYANPESAYKMFGLPLQTSKASPLTIHPAAVEPVSPFVYPKAARDITFGLAYFILQAQQNETGVTAFSAAVAVTGFLDGWTVWTCGSPKMRNNAWRHWIGSAIFTVWVGLRVVKRMQ
ncbi:hypothetical protein QBC33DRAFT_551730 [Phialemonium atrogriseum]|uniref:Uncharacterized protein n=1 Tax=Phialemonium atrogriseum TaxID=1093897 RepID=A0AAJ0FHS9_9PEZI|nr:uncharacterized protein QBC33DRAFT_551730 [Phialemonium atrogriseum]KAK1762509.1 hypothetical protein QBC33DRAFT_551730 [Phialemonium atrogriseum]